MRRKEFQIDDENYEDVVAFLQEMQFGFLGTWKEGNYPGITPINYIYTQDSIYLHGSKAGEKMKSIKHNPNVSFAIAKDYSIIPSYMSDPVYACPATVYFKSVHITGRAEIVEDLEEKCMVLNTLMQKLQPEGGYEPISSQYSGYVSRVKATTVIRINIDQLTAKFKFGQNLKDDQFHNLTQQLEARNEGADAQTVELMQRYCPHHANKETSPHTKENEPYEL